MSNKQFITLFIAARSYNDPDAVRVYVYNIERETPSGTVSISNAWE
jgi:hypothetical protein